MTPIMPKEEIAEAHMSFRVDRACETGMIPVARLTENAIIPTYGSNDAAGLDLYADFSDTVDIFHPLIIAPGERKLVKTGIAMAIPAGHYGRVAPRSGLAYKHGLDVMAGVIDSDYRGDIGVILVNLGQTSVEINNADRIAQLIIEKYTPCVMVECSSLDDTTRAGAGYGSTG